LAVAKQDGLNESTIAEVDHYETSSLSERHKAALRYADALMTQPGSITPQQKADLLLHFTHDQIIELTVDVMKWNYQKVPVSLGTDVEVQEGELTPLIFDAQGNWVKPT
jgi:hypothetical protein